MHFMVHKSHAAACSGSDKNLAKYQFWTFLYSSGMNLR
jgi:hypothetical protein